MNIESVDLVDLLDRILFWLNFLLCYQRKKHQKQENLYRLSMLKKQYLHEKNNIEVIEMKQYIGKKVKIHMKVNGNDLFYEAQIISVTETHINFTDKHEKDYLFRILDIIEMRCI